VLLEGAQGLKPSDAEPLGEARQALLAPAIGVDPIAKPRSDARGGARRWLAPQELRAWACGALEQPGQLSPQLACRYPGADRLGERCEALQRPWGLPPRGWLGELRAEARAQGLGQLTRATAARIDEQGAQSSGSTDTDGAAHVVRVRAQ